MAISGDYPRPVTVNGFSCRNCQDVSLAKRYIDPEHPLSGPYGVSAESDPTQSPAVTFGGSLKPPAETAPAAAPANRLDIRA